MSSFLTHLPVNLTCIEKMSKRCRLTSFVFTLNNYKLEDIEKVSTCDLFSYVCFGKETGENGTPHLQGYAELKKQCEFTQIKDLFPTMHIEKRRGTQEQAVTYCKKDGDFIEIGKLKKQGQRNDLSEVKRIVSEGGTIHDIVEVASNYQTLRAGQLLLSIAPYSSIDYPKKVYWFYGGTGTGKTRTAIELSQNDFWISGEDLKWFDGYTGQQNVIFDDFRGSFCKFSYLLRLLDRYPLRVPIKGGFVIWQPDTIYVTSSYPPDKVYNTREDIGQLLRRITEIREYTLPEDPKIPTIFEDVIIKREFVDMGNGYYLDSLGNMRDKFSKEQRLRYNQENPLYFQ